MASRPCDEFGADALAVRDQIKATKHVEINFSIDMITTMVDDIDDQNASGVIVDHDELRESVLGRYNYSSELEYTAYKMLLDRIYKRRLAHV